MLPRIRCFLAASQRSEDKNSNIAWADLSWADLSGADLSGADLSRANLSGADLSGAYRPHDPPPGYRPDTRGRLLRESGDCAAQTGKPASLDE